jgi:hypothetical protein
MAGAMCACHGAAFATVHKCIDPVTQRRTMASDTACPQEAGPTPAELASQAQAARDKAIASERQRAALRADQQLLSRFPNESAHRKVHLSNLDGVNSKIRFSAARFAELVVQRKPLDDGAAFYKGKPLPLPLQRKIEASDARSMRDRCVQWPAIGRRCDRGNADRRLDELRMLWAGALGVDGVLVMPTALSARVAGHRCADERQQRAVLARDLSARSPRRSGLDRLRRGRSGVTMRTCSPSSSTTCSTASPLDPQTRLLARDVAARATLAPRSTRRR